MISMLQVVLYRSGKRNLVVFAGNCCVFVWRSFFENPFIKIMKQECKIWHSNRFQRCKRLKSMNTFHFVHMYSLSEATNFLVGLQTYGLICGATVIIIFARKSCVCVIICIINMKAYMQK